MQLRKEIVEFEIGEKVVQTYEIRYSNFNVVIRDQFGKEFDYSLLPYLAVRMVADYLEKPHLTNILYKELDKKAEGLIKKNITDSTINNFIGKKKGGKRKK